MTLSRAVLSLLIIGTWSASATAAPTLKLEIGWDGVYKVGRWSPVHVTASNPSPQNVIIELYVSHDPQSGMRIRQNVTIGPVPRTFEILAPLGSSINDLHVTLYEPQTDRRLAMIARPGLASPQGTLLIETASQLIAVSGAFNTDRTISTGLDGWGPVTTRWIDPRRLPAVSQGYDALNLLILDRPDLSRMTFDQQEAIIDWVRGGGHLLCWFGTDPLATSSPLLDAMPADVGDNGVVTIESKSISIRQLSARAQASSITLPGSSLYGYRRQLGFGRLTILPFDPASLDTTDMARWRDWWKPVLIGSVNPDSAMTDDQSADRHVAAIAKARDLLGGEGPERERSPWTLPLVAIAISAALDFFILLSMHRRPLTWTTGAGSAALLAIVLLRFNSASPTEVQRTLRLIDQADNAVIASTLVTNGPSSDDPASWWHPMTNQPAELMFHQDQLGNRPTPQSGHAHPLLAETNSSGRPMIGSDLQLVTIEGKPRITGTITNYSDKPLEKFMIRAGNTTFQITAPPLSPNSSLTVAADSSAGRDDPIWGLSAGRSLQIDRMLTDSPDTAIITAVGARDSMYVRALVRLARE